MYNDQPHRRETTYNLKRRTEAVNEAHLLHTDVKGAEVTPIVANAAKQRAINIAGDEVTVRSLLANMTNFRGPNAWAYGNRAYNEISTFLLYTNM